MKRIQWEYKILTDSSGLDELGREGWELVSVAKVREREKLYLKRPAPSLSEEITLAQRQEVLRGKE